MAFTLVYIHTMCVETDRHWATNMPQYASLGYICPPAMSVYSVYTRKS